MGWLFADIWAWTAVPCVPAGVNLFVSSGWEAQITEMDSLTVLEVRSPRSSCWQGWFLLGTLGDSLLHASLIASGGLPAIFGVPWLVAAKSSPPVAFFLFSFFCPPDFPLFSKTPVILD